MKRLRAGPRRRARAFLPCALLLAVASTAALSAETPPLTGLRIAGLSFRGDAPIDEASMAHLTELTPGERLTEAAMRDSLRNLFATRRFSDLAVEAAPSDGGALVTVVFSAAPRVHQLTLQGNALPVRGRLRDAIALAPGDPWAEDAGREATRALTRLLREQGYFEPAVRSLVEAGPDETTVDVTFDVRPGRRARLGPPVFIGVLTPLKEPELLAAGKLLPGQAYREARAKAAAERLVSLYRERGHWRAEVRYEGERYDTATGLASPRYAVFAGPLVVLQVIGAPEAGVRKHPQSPWARGEPVDEDSVRRLADALKGELQARGYARAKVDVSFRTEPGEDHIHLEIVPGERWAVWRVRFRGNRALSSRRLLGVVSTRPRGLLDVGRLTDAALEADREAIAGAYRDAGYPDVKTGKPEVAEGRRPYTLEVTFPVEEGARAIVARRLVLGATAVPKADLEKELSAPVGSPFRASDVDENLRRLRSVYAEKGFLDARVEATSSVRTPPGAPVTGIEVAYSITEGSPVTFGKTVVRGNRATRLSVVERELVHEEGQPFSLAKTLETQQRLSALGPFQRVELTLFPADPESSSRSLLINLAEAKPWSVLFGVGAEYDSNSEPAFNPRLSAGVSYNNLFGRAIFAGVEGRYSRRASRVLLTLRDRSTFGLGTPTALSLFAAKELRPSFDITRSGMFLEAEKRLSPALRTTLRYQYEIVRPTADPTVLSQLERQDQQIAISSISPGLTIDRREPDPVDTKRGYFVLSEVKWAFPLVAADASFVRAFVQGSLYRPFGRSTLAFGLRAGAIEPRTRCDVSVNPACAPNLEIPVAERFYAGGRTTHRAFALDMLGIPDKTLGRDASGNRVALGGNGLLAGNAEWRIPIFGDFGVALFLDVGNVWAGYRDIRLDQLRWGAGVGLRYLTPVGPIVLDYGWKLDRKVDESPGELHFSIGYPF